MIQLSTQTKKILKDWRGLLRDFTKREYSSALLWSGAGAVIAGLIRLALLDDSFQGFLSSRYMPTTKVFDDPRLYFPYIITTTITVLMTIALRIPRLLWRGARSWWAGVTSGLAFLPFTSTIILFTLQFWPIQRRLLIDLTVVAVFFVAAFLLHLRAKVHAQDMLSEDDLRVSLHVRYTVGTQLAESDDPIKTWKEDALGRASLVDSMSVKLMISKSPVLALFGEFGSGKTSILNLLREHLEGKAIVVSFSTWLPGSQETLTAYLLGDIANECQKQFFVPGLRTSAQQLAKALGKSVPLVRNYLESLPAATQRDDIANVATALMRLPKRVIVLLDELDRMERDELVTLLKVIRGISSLPNISFVCAADHKAIVEIVKDEFNDKSSAYFEKFFPVSIQIPAIAPAALRKAGTERLVATFNRRNRFAHESETELFRQQIDSVWDKRIAPLCRNLRAIGLLANDVGSAAAMLKNEVHPLDLTLIELLRRFKPEIYGIVGRNSVALTGGAGILRGGDYYTDKEIESLGKRLIADIQQATSRDEEFNVVKGILGELFPRFRKIDDQSWPSLVSSQNREKVDEENDKRIKHPEMFPAYFRYELPGAIFSSMELDAVLRKMNSATHGSDIELTFMDALDSMEKGSLKRDDFLRKLADAANKSINIQAGKTLVSATMRAANKYTYDMMAAFGEAGHVLRIVLRVAQRLPVSERLKLLEGCILEAADDTMALNIVRRLPGKHEDFDLEVSLEQLYPAFTKRMRNRYGRDVDAVNIDFSTSDPWAFDYWGHDQKTNGITIDREDKAIQRDFWLRHIGDSRSRLARAFRKFFLPVAVYSEDPAPMVENKIPVDDLKMLYEGLQANGDLTDEDRVSLRVLQRFLNNEFKGGIDPIHMDELYSDESSTTA